MKPSSQLSLKTTSAGPKFKDNSVFLLNLGCSKNQVDSENILGELNSAGFQRVLDPKEARLLIVNTCGFIQDAKEESIAEVLSLATHKNKDQKLVVAGCLSERYRAELIKELPEVDAFYGVYKPGEIAQVEAGWMPTNCDTVQPRSFLHTQEKHHAYLKIAEGCNRVCGFCAIPGMRGKQKSRGLPDIIRECQSLQKAGVLEVSLIAQDLTFYGREKKGAPVLSDLLKTLLAETDIPWFRLMYAYPAYIDDALLDILSQNNRLCKYLDMPIQHSHTDVLQRMRRGHTEKSLRSILGRIKEAVPQIALRTTVLVGYPGETEAEFKHLLNFVEEQKFDRLGGFTYSDEEGTYAFDELKAKRVSQKTSRKRLDELMALQQSISYEKNQAYKGQTLKVLVDQAAPQGEAFDFLGRSEKDAPEVDNSILIQGDCAVGTFVDVTITEAHEFDLLGHIA